MYSLGTNNAANAIGALLGAGITSLRFGQALFIVGVILGALLEGYKLSLVLGGNGELAGFGIETLSILMTATILTCFATYIGAPLPVTLAIVGGSWGIGILRGQIVCEQVLKFVIAWALTPMIAAIVSLALFKLSMEVRRRARRILNAVLAEGVLSLLGSFYIAYVLGANTVGLIAGLASSHAPIFLILAAGVITGFGGTRGIKVCQTVGEQFVGLGVTASAIVQVSSALVIHMLTQFSCPASITQAVVGAILGVGLFKGLKAVNLGLTARVFSLWAFTPALAAVLASFVYLLITSIL